MFVTKEIMIHTSKPFDIRDLTDEVVSFLKEAHATNGLVNIFTRHTTAIIKVNEAEDGLRNDLQSRSDKSVPIDIWYQHNDLEHRDPKTMCASKEECLNGHAHLRAMLLGVTSETIPVQHGEMSLGERQRILLIEMDHARERKIIFSFMGE